MSERMLRIFLKDLVIVKIRCSRLECGAVAEVRLEHVASPHVQFHCPGCGDPFTMPGRDNDYIGAMARAMQKLKDATDGPTVEFVIPDNSLATLS
jgi:hypothetical protein